MKTKAIIINWKPLRLAKSITAEKGVSDRQDYDADSNEYTPDYTLTPLTVQPNFSVIDKDEVILAGRANKSLYNIAWYAIEGGVKTAIGSTNTNYEILTSGDDAGRIKVKRNIKVGSPVTLVFHAEYTDPRNKQQHNIDLTYLLKCNNSTAYIPQLVLDANDNTQYNPLRDVDEQTVHASLRLGTEECPAAKRIFVWEKFRADSNSWSLIGSDLMDYDVSVASDGLSCTVNRKLMGSKLSIRCRAKYDINGNPSSVTLGDNAPCKMVTFVRRLPWYDKDILGMPTNITPDIMYVNPVASIRDNEGILTNPDSVLIPLWYIATNKTAGSLSYDLVAHGMTASIPAKYLDTAIGAVVGLDTPDRGVVAAWKDADGNVFKDADGKILLIH